MSDKVKSRFTPQICTILDQVELRLSSSYAAIYKKWCKRSDLLQKKEELRGQLDKVEKEITEIEKEIARENK